MLVVALIVLNYSLCGKDSASHPLTTHYQQSAIHPARPLVATLSQRLLVFTILRCKSSYYQCNLASVDIVALTMLVARRLFCAAYCFLLVVVIATTCQRSSAAYGDAIATPPWGKRQQQQSQRQRLLIEQLQNKRKCFMCNNVVGVLTWRMYLNCLYCL